MKHNCCGRRRRMWMHAFLLACAISAALGLFILTIKPVDPSSSKDLHIPLEFLQDNNNHAPVAVAVAVAVAAPVPAVVLNTTNGFESEEDLVMDDVNVNVNVDVDVDKNSSNNVSTTCASVEEMGKVFELGFEKESLRVRKLIRDHFDLYGASTVRSLPPEQFCRHGFVIGKSSEAGFGNEMYKILTAAALSIMLNRSLIIGQTRGKYPFGDYITYTEHAFTLKEVKHLWRQNGCIKTYGRQLVVRIDNFQKPTQSHILCSNWREWLEPVIWFQGATDAVAAQFFLKSIHPEMRNAASNLFGMPEDLHNRPNLFGELIKVLISPSDDVREAVNWVLQNGLDVDISLHMRMLMNRSVRAIRAALDCIKKATNNVQQVSRPRVVLVSDTPSLIKDIKPRINEFAEVVHFDYQIFKGNISNQVNKLHNLDFRVKDWGPAPRWVAFVDFFLASRAKYAVVSGAQRRVGTTYAQLIAGLAAANNLEDDSSVSNFSFLSSFQSNLLSEGLRMQVGWGHVWNRFAGPLSCRSQTNQCASTPLLPPAWWDGLWQSPIPRDIRRMEGYGIQLSGLGTFNETYLQTFCKTRKKPVITMPISQM